MNKKERKKQQNEVRHAFLRTFFDQEKDHYEEKEVNGFLLIKQFNALTNRWEVAIYSKDAYERKQQYLISRADEAE